MAIRTNPRTLVDNDADPALPIRNATVASTPTKSAYLDDLQEIPPLADNTEIFITECTSINRLTQMLNNLPLNVGTTNSTNTFNNTLTNPTKIGFDQDSGFTVNDAGSGMAKISLNNNTFRNWDINGSPALIAGENDTVNFVAGCNVFLYANSSSSPKTLTINAAPTGSNKELQYNNAGVFASSSSLTWDNAKNMLNVSVIGSGPIHESFFTTTSSVIDVESYSLFYYPTGMTSDFVLTINNLNLESGYATNIVLILNQGSSAGVPTSAIVNGITVNFKYPDGTPIAATPNSVDIVNISLFKISSTNYLAIAQLTSCE